MIAALNEATGALQIQAGSGYAWFAGIVLAVAVALSARAWWRSRRRPAILVLEALRLTLIAALLFVLAAPEWVVTEPVEENALVTVLWDDSGSMETRDVRAQDGELRTRAVACTEAVDALSADPDGVLPEGTRLTTTSLSSALGDGADPAAGTNLSEPLAALLDESTLRAVVLLSDGDWNEGERPDDVAERYRLAGVPILPYVIGSPTRQPDLVLEPIEPPAFGVVGRPIDLSFTIDSALSRDVTTTVSLTRDGVEVSPRRTLLLPAQRRSSDAFVYRPVEPGRHTLTVSVAPVDGELETDDNERTFEIEVREERLRVLLVESRPRWEYRYLRNALVRDPGVEPDCLLLHPGLGSVGGGPHYLDAFPPDELLSEYDVIFVGDVGAGSDGLTETQCEAIVRLVRDQAAGLILMPGSGGGWAELVETELGALFPVDLDAGEPWGIGGARPAPLVLTEAGERSSLTRLVHDRSDNTALWSSLPGFQWHAPVSRARTGSQVLAVHGTRENERGRIPLLVTRTARTGKVLFMGTDGAWRWREGYEDLYHYRFWGQVVRWMAYQRSMNKGESMRLFFTPDRPRVRSAVALNANVMDAAGAPLAGATLNARIESPSGRIEHVAFEPESGDEDDRDAWGLYGALFRPTEPGRHRATLTCEETGATLEAEIPVIGDPLERRGRAARGGVLTELARLSRGAVLGAPTLDALAGRLAALPPPDPLVSRLRLWAHPALGAVIALLMVLFWIGRRVAGRI